MELSNLGFTEGMIVGPSMSKNPNGPRVLDWQRAAEICKSTNFPVVAGLAEDWTETSDVIYDGQNFVDPEYAYVKSDWATPTILICDEACEPQECWKLATDEDSPNCPNWWTTQKAEV